VDLEGVYIFRGVGVSGSIGMLTLMHTWSSFGVGMGESMILTSEADLTMASFMAVSVELIKMVDICMMSEE